MVDKMYQIKLRSSWIEVEYFVFQAWTGRRRVNGLDYVSKRQPYLTTPKRKKTHLYACDTERKKFEWDRTSNDS